MRALTTDQLDDLYNSFKRDVPVKGIRHVMTITEYYREVWSKPNAKGVEQYPARRDTRYAGWTVTTQEKITSTVVPRNGGTR